MEAKQSKEEEVKGGENDRDKKLITYVLRVFDSEEDRKHYGYTERALNYMKLSVSSYKNTLKIEDSVIRDESDYIKVDDTWLKVYKIMLD